MTTKITPAMREWCRLLSNPERHYWTKHSGAWFVTSGGRGSIGAPNHPMVSKMEDAELIRWEERKTEHGPRWFAVLTETGAAIAAKAVAK